MTEHAVVIAGGGPIGLMLADELALAGIDVVIVKRGVSQEGPAPMSREQVQCADLGLHDGEVSAIDRCDVAHAQTFGRGNDGCVDRAERKVAILHDQLCDAHPVGRGNWLGDEVAGGEITEEANLGIDAQSGAKQVDDFGDDEGRHDQWPGVRLE